MRNGLLAIGLAAGAHHVQPCNFMWSLTLTFGYLWSLLTWCSSWIFASVGMEWSPWWAPNTSVSPTWSLGDGLGEDLKSILHLVTRTSRIVNATDVVARSYWICILYLHVALCPRRLRQDVTGLVLGKLDY